MAYVIISQWNAKCPLDTVGHRFTRHIWILSFQGTRMANRARRTYREQDLWKLTYGDGSDSELDSGSSADEEAELEHELQIFGDESR